MIRPLAVVSSGYLGRSALSIAVDGWLSAAVIPVPIVEEAPAQSQWAGEWLPIPVPKSLEPAQKRPRKVKIHGKARGARAKAAMVVLPTAHVTLEAKRHGLCRAAIACSVDSSIVREEETIIAALAAFL